MQPVTGSISEKQTQLTPFEQAQADALIFMIGMQTSSAFEELANRIQTIEALMKLPVMHMSSSSESIKVAKKDYKKEMEEIELAIKLITVSPGVPEA